MKNDLIICHFFDMEMFMLSRAYLSKADSNYVSYVRHDQSLGPNSTNVHNSVQILTIPHPARPKEVVHIVKNIDDITDPHILEMSLILK